MRSVLVSTTFQKAHSMTTRSRLKIAIKRTRAKLHKAKSETRVRMPGAAVRAALHAQSLVNLLAPAVKPAATAKR
jgi:hypothetical protein